MIAAHPDDEDTQLLARLALAEGAEVAYLSLTRGEGGQNAIGPDFQEALGIIRTEELLAARRVDGARQFFGREYDYGFSKSAAEAFQHWPRDSVLEDVVRVIRAFRPDVIVSVWSGTQRDGHGQHQASGIVAKEAYAAAADSARFPALLQEGLRPWAASKLYEGSYFRRDSLTTRYDTGVLDPLLGLSYAEVAAISRGRHRSQDMARALPLGPASTGVNLVDWRARGTTVRASTDGAGGEARRASARESSIFTGLDTTLAQRAASTTGIAPQAARLLATYDSTVRAARAGYQPLDPDALVPGLAQAAQLLAAADSALGGSAAGSSLRFYLRSERQDLDAALAGAEGLVFDAMVSAEQLAPGDSVGVVRTLWNGGKHEVRWSVTPDSTVAIGPGEMASRTVAVRVPTGSTDVTQPYYLAQPRHGDLYTWPTDPAVDGLPFQPPFSAPARVEIAGAPVLLRREVTFRAVSPREGETRRPLRLVPAVSVSVDRDVAVRPLALRMPLTLETSVTAEQTTGTAGELRLVLPPGWRAIPATASLRLAGGESHTVRFAVMPPATLSAGTYDIAAVFRDGSGREYGRGFRLIEYPHIRPHPLYADARTRVEAVDVTVPQSLTAKPIGYVMGAGDDVPQALAQLGIHVELLSSEALATGDLARFRDIVVGVRAYEMRPDLAAANRRLLDWVRAGGTLVVQYQQASWAAFAPYPMAFAPRADRVTDETAPVKVLDPISPLLTRPNRIGPADWDGWVQERGLWFPHTWDAHWRALLEMSDPGEAPLQGGLLVARYGQGTVVYTGLSFFRELPAGVAGAHRLFVNLLAAGPMR